MDEAATSSPRWTAGRRYCFAIVGFNDRYQFFKRVQEIVSETTGCECKRGDELLGPGADLRAKIHAAIEGAAFVIADLSTTSANVYYEVGYAVARSKPIILIARKDADIPTDLKGVEVLLYADTAEGGPAFEKGLRAYLQAQVESAASLLHSFVLPEKPAPTYIVANPKLPGKTSGFKYHPVETRTYGDYLGVAGILAAFASLYGENLTPELVSAMHAAESLKDTDANFYLIGSPKVNPFTEWFLAELQGDSRPGWRMDSVPADKRRKDPRCQLTGRLPDGVFSCVATEGPEDYGLILRGPHPRFPSRLVMILAGPQALGTGSACLAATKSELIRSIREKIGNDEIFMDRTRPLWVLVKGEAGADRLIRPDGVKVVAAGVCAPAD
jgi:hypothetical protein